MTLPSTSPSRSPPTISPCASSMRSGKWKSNSVAPNAKFPLKTRTDRANALFSGRGFMMNYAVSEPEYRNKLRSRSSWRTRSSSRRVAATGHCTSTPAARTSSVPNRSSRAAIRPGAGEEAYPALPLDRLPPDSGDEDTQKAHSPSSKPWASRPRAAIRRRAALQARGDGLTINGAPLLHRLLALVQVWVRFDKLKEIFSADIYPWVSWATHEDNKNFLPKSYADDLYGIADATTPFSIRSSPTARSAI